MLIIRWTADCRTIIKTKKTPTFNNGGILCINAVTMILMPLILLILLKGLKSLTALMAPTFAPTFRKPIIL